MGLRFRKSIKIAPGLKLNLNKKSMSVTAGTRGAHVTMSSTGKKTTSVGIPGTGLSYTTSSSKASHKKSKKPSGASGQRRSSAPASGNHNNSDKKWYQKNSGIILLLIFFFPVGLYLMWKYSKWSNKVKGVITGLFALGFIGAMIPSDDALIESINLNIPDYQEAYDVNSEIPFELSISPDSAASSSIDYVTSDESISVSDNHITTGDTEGVFEVYAEIDNIKSNTLTITVKSSDVALTQPEEIEVPEETTDATPPLPEEEPDLTDMETQTMYATSEVNIRSGAGTDTEILGKTAKGDSIEMLSIDGDWAKILYNGAVAYIATDYISEQLPPSDPPTTTASSSDMSAAESSENNFNTYDNPEQHNTADTYVLNTSTKKIHYPSCSSVEKISPQNYSTSSLSVEELESQGYAKCKRCF